MTGKMKFPEWTCENVWLTKNIYEDAEAKYYENLSKTSLTPLAGEVAKARQRLIESRDVYKVDPICAAGTPGDTQILKFIEKKIMEFDQSIGHAFDKISAMETRLQSIEKAILSGIHKMTQTGMHEINITNVAEEKESKDEDDDVDLFASESEEESEAVAKMKEERLAAYNAKKSKKPALIAKSNVILDVKPWDDETNMKEMEEHVRAIVTEGLLWGAAKLQPLAYGIHKLQISCVVEDDKVSIDWLQEQIEAIEEYVQSVDIAAFNKI